MIYVDGFIQKESNSIIGYRLKEHKLFVDLDSITIQSFNFHLHAVSSNNEFLGRFVTLNIRDTTIDIKNRPAFYYLIFIGDDLSSYSFIRNTSTFTLGKGFC